MKRPAIAAGLIVAVLGAVGLVVRSEDGEAATTPVVLGQRSSEVRSMVIESGGRRVELTRGGDGTWRPEPGTSPQSATLLFSLEDRLLPMLAYRALAADPTDPQFGLEPPDVVLRIETAGGARRRVDLGAPTFTGGGFYARVTSGRMTGGRGRAGEVGPLYLVPRRTMDELRSVIEGRPVRSADPVGDRIDQFEAEQAEAEEETGMNPYLQQVLDAEAHVPQGPR